MRCDRANRPAAILIMIAAALPGCASSKKCQTVNAVRPTIVPPAVMAASQANISNIASLSREAYPQAEASIARVAAPNPSAIQLASFSQSPSSPPSPAEIVVAPEARPFDQDRPIMPLDLPTALGMTEGQNP